MSSVVVVLLLCLFGYKVVPNVFKVHGSRELSRVPICVVMENFMGEGMLGPIGVGLRVFSKWSIEIPGAPAVATEIL